MKMKKIIRFGLASAILMTVSMVNARAADPIADLNANATRTIKASKDPLPVTAVENAIVQLAVYDAVESIDRRYQPYYAFVPEASGSMTAAAAKATHDTLAACFLHQIIRPWRRVLTATTRIFWPPTALIQPIQELPWAPRLQPTFWRSARMTAGSRCLHHRPFWAVLQSASGGRRRRLLVLRRRLQARPDSLRGWRMSLRSP